MPSIDSLANLAYSTIESVNGNGDGTALDIVDEARFPDPATNGAYNIVVKHDDGAPATIANAEIMRVTAKSGTTFTVTRDQESTTGITCLVGDIVFIAPTVANIKQALHMEHISTVTLTDDAVADFVLQNATYKSYLFLLENVVPVTDATNLILRTDSDGGVSFDEGASDYSWVIGFAAHSTTPTPTAVGDNADAGGRILSGVGSDVDEGASASLFLYGPAVAQFTRWSGTHTVENDDGNYRSGWLAGARHSAADVDAVRFLFSSGNLESGVIRMYGLKGD